MARGQKTCPKCQRQTGPRTKVCQCGHDFAIINRFKLFKPKETKESVSWQQLVQGDLIKVLDGGGPEWPSERGPVSMRLKGKYRVIEIKENGIVAADIKYGGVRFIYMGPEEFGITGMYLRAHKIARLKAVPS